MATRGWPGGGGAKDKNPRNVGSTEHLKGGVMNGNKQRRVRQHREAVKK